MNEISKCFWVEGMIADWNSRKYSSDQRYLIEDVNVEGHQYVNVRFRNLDSWNLYPSNHRGMERRECDGSVIIREPTDKEYALIAKKRLLGE